MSTLSESVLGIYQFQWNPNPGHNPPQSGVYLTRNQRDQLWLRYFDARLGDWYASWVETKTRTAQATARLSHAEHSSEVMAWAHRTRTVRGRSVRQLAPK